MKIKSFSKQYSFLSNFYTSPFVLRGRRWQTVEHYFQAAKTNDYTQQEKIRKANNSNIAKRLGRQVKLKNNWEDIKETIMLRALRAKFKQNKILEDKLITTNSAWLEEGNNWHDSYWGVCYCVRCQGNGMNRLGYLLMQVRKELK